MKIQCSTTFDITATGVTGHFRSARLPFVDRSGQKIASEQDWNRSRNQQRNWETIQQLISLRIQVAVDSPDMINGVWQFCFDVDSENIFATDDNALGVLVEDCAGIPMLTGLNEPQQTITTLVPDVNIWFSVVPINTSEDLKTP